MPAQPDDAQEPTDTQPAVHNSIKSLLDSVGIAEYEPQVVDMLVDFVYAYAKDVLSDARAYGEASGAAAGEVNLEHVELAIRSRMDMSFAQAPSLETLLSTAQRINATDLPKPEGRPGVPLPGSRAMLGVNAQYDPAGAEDGVDIPRSDAVLPREAPEPMDATKDVDEGGSEEEDADDVEWEELPGSVPRPS